MKEIGRVMGTWQHGERKFVVLDTGAVYEFMPFGQHGQYIEMGPVPTSIRSKWKDDVVFEEPPRHENARCLPDRDASSFGVARQECQCACECTVLLNATNHVVQAAGNGQLAICITCAEGRHPGPHAPSAR